jgi:hypothetical protein
MWAWVIVSSGKARARQGTYISYSWLQRLDDAVAARSYAGMGSDTPDDDRRVLSCHVSRDLGQNDHQGG